jgi:hypothetical protein
VKHWNGDSENSFYNLKTMKVLLQQKEMAPPTVVNHKVHGDLDGAKNTAYDSLEFVGTVDISASTVYIGKDRTLSLRYGVVPKTYSYQQYVYCTECSGHECWCTKPSSLCGTDGEYHGSDECAKDNYCGICTYYQYLRTVCIAVDFAKMYIDLEHSGCTYPFNGQNFYTTNKPTTYNVTIRDSRDPFFTVQDLTEGTAFFRSSHMKDGIIVGLVAVILLIGSCYCCKTRRAPLVPSEYLVFNQPTRGVNYGSAVYAQPPLLETYPPSDVPYGAPAMVVPVTK